MTWNTKLYSTHPYESYRQLKWTKEHDMKIRKSRRCLIKNLTTFCWVYRKFVKETSTITRLEDIYKYQKKQNKEKDEL